MKKQTPLGYVAEPEELAGPVVFLASDHAQVHHRLHAQRLRRLPDVLTPAGPAPRTGAARHHASSRFRG